MTRSPMITYQSDPNQKHIFSLLYEEIFVREDYKVHLKRRNPIIFDCGANIGLASLYFALKFPHSKILAFEPNPSAVHYFQKNTTHLQKYGQLEFYQVALAKENTLGFFNTTPFPGSVFASSKFTFNGPRIPVNFRKLSDYTDCFDTIDLAKIDIEGAEWDVLEELIQSDTLKKFDQMIIELHQPHHLEDRKEEFINMFIDNGFEVKIRSTFDTKPFKCIVMHCAKY